MPASVCVCGQLSYDMDRCLSVGQSPRRTEAVGRCSEQAHVQAGKAGMIARGTGEIDAVARLLEHVGAYEGSIGSLVYGMSLKGQP